MSDLSSTERAELEARVAAKEDARRLRGEHAWQRGVRKRMPVMECGNCGLVWWPDQNKPKGTCRG